jgi:hypothetical protein
MEKYRIESTPASHDVNGADVGSPKGNGAFQLRRRIQPMPRTLIIAAIGIVTVR